MADLYINIMLPSGSARGEEFLYEQGSCNLLKTERFPVKELLNSSYNCLTGCLIV